MTWVYFALGVLATWRVTHLLVAEDGPWDLFARLRRRLGKSMLGKLLDCFYCFSLWVSAVFCVFLAQTPKDAFLLWLSLSAAAILLENVSARLGQPASAAYFVEGDQENELLRKDQQHSGAAE
jgi:hypothetical protein